MVSRFLSKAITQARLVATVVAPTPPRVPITDTTARLSLTGAAAWPALTVAAIACC